MSEEAISERVEELKGALRATQAKQPEALAIIRKYGFVFKDIGRERGNWQHLAFTLYSLLCEIEAIAAAALNEE